MNIEYYQIYFPYEKEFNKNFSSLELATEYLSKYLLSDDRIREILNLKPQNIIVSVKNEFDLISFKDIHLMSLIEIKNIIPDFQTNGKISLGSIRKQTLELVA